MGVEISHCAVSLDGLGPRGNRSGSNEAYEA